MVKYGIANKTKNKKITRSTLESRRTFNVTTKHSNVKHGNSESGKQSVIKISCFDHRSTLSSGVKKLLSLLASQNTTFGQM